MVINILLLYLTFTNVIKYTQIRTEIANEIIPLQLKVLFLTSLYTADQDLLNSIGFVIII